MRVTVFRSADWAEEERLTAWYDVVRGMPAPNEILAPPAEGFHVTAHLLDLGPAHASLLTASPGRLRRTPAAIRRSDPELYQLVLPLRGSVTVSQSGREAVAGPHQLVVCHTSVPYEVATVGEDTLAATPDHAAAPTTGPERAAAAGPGGSGAVVSGCAAVAGFGESGAVVSGCAAVAGLGGSAATLPDHAAATLPDHAAATPTDRTGAAGDVSEVAVAEIPGALLPLPAGRVDRLIARPLAARDGVGALLAGFLTRLTADTGGYRPTDAPRLSTVLTDLAAALFAHALEAEPEVTPESRRRTLLLRIEAFVRQNLAEAGLTPDAVAAAHHISPRYLYRLFEQRGETVAAFIRRERLERCRRDLADPAHRAVPVHAVAARWGFTHHADFSRAFRRAYGTTPSDFRRAALAGSA